MGYKGLGFIGVMLRHKGLGFMGPMMGYKGLGLCRGSGG